MTDIYQATTATFVVAPPADGGWAWQVDFPDVHPAPDECKAADAAPAYGPLTFNVSFDTPTCSLTASWHKQYLVPPCWEGPCESMSYRLQIQGDTGAGTRTYLEETCGHGNGVPETFGVIAARVK